MATPYFTVELGLSATSSSFTLDSATKGQLSPASPGPDYPLGDDLGYTWTNISDYVLDDGFAFQRGSTRAQGPWWRYESGSASFAVDNLDGRFDPLNLSGPYVSGGVTNLRPGLPVRISAVVDTGTEIMWMGVVDSIALPYDSATWSTARFTCVDAVERLQAADLPELTTAVGAGDTVAARIDRILDRMGWPAAARDLDTITANTLQATTMAQSSWAQILLSADSDAGYVWIDRTGNVVWRTRSALTSTASVQFSSVAESTALGFDEISISRDVQQVYNSISLARAGGTALLVEDVDQQALIGQVRGYSRSDLVCENDAQLGDVATWVLSSFAALQTRVEGITVRPPADTDLLSAASWLTLLRLDIGTTISVSHATPDGRTITSTGVVRGVEWSAGVRSFEVKFSLQQITTDIVRFVLDTDKLDVGSLGTSALVRS
jgi:hypothetical protein